MFMSNVMICFVILCSVWPCVDLMFLTLYSMYLCILYMSPLYINMFLYFSSSLFYLSYFTWLYCVCPPFLKTVFFLSWITCIMLCMYILYFKRCTLYKFIEINYVLFCSVNTCVHLWLYVRTKWAYDLLVVKWINLSTCQTCQTYIALHPNMMGWFQ